jgi:hypothetical protein
MQSKATLGPVDVEVLAFPGGLVNGRVSAVMADVVASGAARLLDALLVEKRSNGDVVVTDIEQYGESLEIIRIPGQLPGLLSDTDVDKVATDLQPGSAALLIAWENSWAVRLRQAVSESGGVVVLHERIADAEISDVVQYLAALQES